MEISQVCVVGSRLIVQSSIYQRFMDELLEVTPKKVRLRKKWLSEADRARARRGLVR